MRTILDLINSLKKIIEEGTEVFIPEGGRSSKLELKDHSFYYWVDINRKGHRLKRYTLQLREQQRKEFPLLRLDLYGPSHPNPEGDFPMAGEMIPCPHLHIAHPEYGDSIAYPLNSTYAKMYLTEELLEDAVYVLGEFLKRCNVANSDDYSYVYQEELL